MAQALFLICMFLITVSGLLLFKPPVPQEKITDIRRITEYSTPQAQISRQQIALGMARFLEKNPKIVKQERLTSLPVEPVEISANPPVYDQQESQYRQNIRIKFQGSENQFQSQEDFDSWVNRNLQMDPVAFLREFQNQDDPDLYLKTLKKISENNADPVVANEIKISYLKEAGKLIAIQNGFEQQMTQQALQQYLDLEEDKEAGKKTVEAFLQEHQQNSGQPNHP